MRLPVPSEVGRGTELLAQQCGRRSAAPEPGHRANQRERESCLPAGHSSRHQVPAGQPLNNENADSSAQGVNLVGSEGDTGDTG